MAAIDGGSWNFGLLEWLTTFALGAIGVVSSFVWGTRSSLAILKDKTDRHEKEIEGMKTTVQLISTALAGQPTKSDIDGLRATIEDRFNRTDQRIDALHRPYPSQINP